MTEIQRRLQALEIDAERRRESQENAESIDINAFIAPVYMPLHADVESHAHQFYNLPGGRGSGKSSYVSLEIVSGVMKDPTGESNAIIFRRTANTMRESVYTQIAWAIDVLDVGEYWDGKVSPMTWTYKPTGAQIIFRGLDDVSKLKSIKPKRGVFRYIWLEEFSELPGENFVRSIMQSVMRGGGNFTVFRSFNPPLSKSNWANLFIARHDDRAITLHTTYKDVPSEWLGEEFITEAERLQEINPQAYDHEYLGIATGSGGEVFPNVDVRTITDEEIQEMQYFYCGIDWGFSIDPACFVRVSYDAKKDILYILDEIYKTHISNADLAELIKARGYDQSSDYYKSLWGGDITRKKQVIVADSAEPKSINDMQGLGLNVIACRKYPGCVNYRIKWLQSRKIVIDPARTPNAHREFINYEYVQSKDGEFLADVPDKNNHSIDSVAYACDRLIYQKQYTA